MEIEALKQNINPKTARFRDADWYEPNLAVIVGGAGGIGSYLSFFLSARQENKIHLYDFDHVEEHNQGGQLYRNTDINMKKTEMMKDIIRNFSNIEIFTYDIYKEDSHVLPIMFSAFDNMKARKIMFENWKKLESRELFIDGRMNAEQGQVYFVTKGREEEYEKTLFDDSEVEDLPCNYKATSHCGAIIASLMLSGFNNYIGNKKTGLGMRELPFHIHYLLQLFKFDVLS